MEHLAGRRTDRTAARLVPSERPRATARRAWLRSFAANRRLCAEAQQEAIKDQLAHLEPDSKEGN